ncbi:unnamed protein product, partial [Pylaiella littoralis]
NIERCACPCQLLSRTRSVLAQNKTSETPHELGKCATRRRDPTETLKQIIGSERTNEIQKWWPSTNNASTSLFTTLETTKSPWTGILFICPGALENGRWKRVRYSISMPCFTRVPTFFIPRSAQQ